MMVAVVAVVVMVDGGQMKQREVKAGVPTRKHREEVEEEVADGETTEEEQEALIPAIQLRKRMFMTWRISRSPQLTGNRRNLKKYMGTDMKRTSSLGETAGTCLWSRVTTQHRYRSLSVVLRR